MRRHLLSVAPLALSVALLFSAHSALALQAPAFSIHITVDEHGVGTFTNTAGFNSALTGTLKNDPGPGGLTNVLTYDLLNPPGLIAGDVLLEDSKGLFLDVLRFNASNGSLVFYSDNLDGADSLGDTPGPPTSFYANRITIAELGTEANNFADYTPLAGQPGFVAGAAGPVMYTFISDGNTPTVPEPSSLALMGSGLVGALGILRRRLSA